MGSSRIPAARFATPMDRALSIAEIRYLICTVALDYTLVQLSQCSKRFHEPAIRVLWNTVPDLSPLVRCLPQDAWTMVDSSIGAHIVSTNLLPNPFTAHVSSCIIEAREASNSRGLDDIPQGFSFGVTTWDIAILEPASCYTNA